MPIRSKGPVAVTGILKTVCLFTVILCVFLTSARASGFKAEADGLTPKFAPELIQSNAREGKFLPVKMMEKPVTWVVFDKMIRKTMADGGNVIAVGVIVDAKNEHWPSDELTAHIIETRNTIVSILRGDNDNGVVGFAELYGARVQAVVPIIYEPGQSLTLTKNDKKTDVPLEPGHILLAVNDHTYAFREGGVLIDSVDELRPHLQGFLEDGRNLVSAEEYREQAVAYLEQLNRKIARAEASNAKLEGDNIENLLMQGLLDSGTFRPSTAKGRANRKIVETYFDTHGLPMNKLRYDLVAIHDTYRVHAVGLYRRGCDAGDADSCTALAFSYQQGNGVAADAALARKLFRQACDGGSSLACKTIQ